jgi:flagellum-specific ATP synthase
VVEANGQWLESEGPIADIGECCEVRSRAGGPPRPGEVVGFHEQRTLVMLLEPDAALRYGDELIGLGEQPSIGVGAGLLGRVIDARGRPIDGQGMVRAETRAVIRSHAPGPFARLPIRDPYTTGVRAIDAMLSIGQGQRVGIFGGSGVGKSTLMGMLSRVSESQITVIALVGERGREVLDFVENSLGPGGLAHSVLVVATSDQSPLLKMRAAESATTIAEYFQAQGRDVLLIIDSLTRYAMAAREIGLANGEPPTSKGYTPSVFSRLARLVERAGRFRRGSITGIYTVLMEGDDHQDPIVDAVRSYVDGHIMLSRPMALDGWYPPIDVLGSISRLMPAIVTPRHAACAARVRRLLAAYAASEDLIRIGAYKAGSDPALDQAISLRPRLRQFLEQSSSQSASFAAAAENLEALVP